jgi:excisionase family DNA binding protein
MEKINLDQDLITTGQAAQLTGREPSTFRYALMRGDVRARQVGTLWLMRREDIEQYAQTGHWPERNAAERKAIKEANGIGTEVKAHKEGNVVGSGK